MTGAVVCGYLVGWLLTSTVALLTASRARRPQWLSIVAGAVWPVLAVAVAQMMLIALMATLIRRTDAGPADTTYVTFGVDDTFVKTV